MKGRTPTTREKTWHDQLAQHVGCLPCLQDNGVRNTWVSIHHIDGRTKPDAHWQVLPLCGGHHQEGRGLPGQLAVHGHKRRFETMYGTQQEQLTRAAEQLLDMGCEVPERVLELTGLATEA